MTNVVVLGGNFAGVSAALEVKRKLGKAGKVIVVSPTSNFLYVPSLIWVPFGKRKVNDITFPIEPVLNKKGVLFLKDKAIKVNPEENEVLLNVGGSLKYDYLVVATGVDMNFDVVDHLKPEEGYIQNIVIPRYSEKSFEAFKEFVKDPGPVVIGATQGASCMGAAYEYLFNLEKQLRKNKVRDKVDITWITPEPFLGHFGIGGITGGEKMLKMFMKMFKMKFITNAVIEKIEKDRIILKDGTELPYKLSMLIPPFIGAEVMRNSPELVDKNGFVETNDGYQHIKYKNVYAAGLAVKVVSPFNQCAVPFGVPKTGFPSDVMGKIAAYNIVNDVKKTGKFRTRPFGKIPGVCVMDAGEKEVWIFTNHLFKPRQFEVMVPNVFYNFGKILVEKYMLFKNRKGLSYLP